MSLRSLCSSMSPVIVIITIFNICSLQGKECFHPGHGPHSYTNMTHDIVQPGTIVTYGCDQDYQLLGNSERLCHKNGSWSGKQPVCVINIARHRQVSYQSQFIDEESRTNSRYLLDDYYSTCSTAKKADLVPSVWTIDLLEEQSFSFIQIAVGDGLKNVHFTLYYGNSSESRDEIPLQEDYEPQIHSQTVEFEMIPVEIIEYGFWLRKPVIGRYVTVKIWPQQGRFKLTLCEVSVCSTKAPTTSQCRLSLIDKVPLAVHDTKCFSFHRNEKLEWDDARKRCGAFNGTLVTRVTTPSQEFLRNTLRTLFDPPSIDDVFWVGGHKRQDYVEEGITPIMRWLNETTKKYFVWSDSTTSVSNALDSCLTISGPLDWKWTLQNCLTHYPWICQFDIPSCGSPEQQPLTSLEVSNRQIGDTAVYSCPIGYVLNGPAVRTCLPSGLWSEFPPTCKYVNCGQPDQIDNATIVFLQGSTTYGSAIEYTCTSPSLHLSGLRSRICQRDGKWSGDNPICSEGVPDPERQTSLLRWEVLLGIALGCMFLLLIVTVITFVIIYTNKQTGTRYIRETERKNMLARFDSDDSIATTTFANGRNMKSTPLIYAYENEKPNGKV